MLKLDKNLWALQVPNLNDWLYVNKDETDIERWNFFDSNKNFIDSFYGNISELYQFTDKVRKIKNIYDLVDLGLSINMMFAPSLEELLEEWNNYIEEEYNPYSLEDFKEIIPYNRVGQHYFIVNYTEI